MIIHAVNECGEIRVIEVLPTQNHMERRDMLEVLLTKCRRLMSFVESVNRDTRRIANLYTNIRLAFYMNDDITDLIEEYEECKRSSRFL
jgi:hypothetical protein